MKKYLMLFLLALQCEMTFSKDLSTLASSCQDNWVNVEKTLGSQINQKHLAEWLSLKDKCSGTGVYEYRLAYIYRNTGDSAEAKNLLHDSLEKNIDNKYMLKASLLELQYSELALSGNKELEKYEEIVQGYKHIINSNPKWVPAYELVSGIELFINKEDDAYSHATKALELKPESWAAMRNLLVIHAQRKEYELARQYIVPAVKLNEWLLGETEFSMAAAVTYINLDELKTAEAVLTNLLQRRPDIKADPTFINIVKHLKTKLQQP